MSLMALNMANAGQKTIKAIPNHIFVSRKNAGRFSKDLRRKKHKNLSSVSCFDDRKSST